jgi:hypothetical protein
MLNTANTSSPHYTLSSDSPKGRPSSYTVFKVHINAIQPRNLKQRYLGTQDRPGQTDKKNVSNHLLPHRWCLHLTVVVGFECSRDPESYACGSVATGRGTHAGQLKG